MTLDLETRVAQAINGPYFPLPEGSKPSLDELRQVRWNMLNEAEKGTRKIQARAVIALMQGETK